ncbi:MAG TPA: acetylneuraminic acid synthetase [Verrucomicrobia bacterium]|nr:MAG: acetylneuraminic acid synthetase [Lentisphaerae bacterium GWF2_57_35]HBA86059.1 acetylneuraminic acid synthetase [Verrucomicrobiota bacterium]
MIIERIVSRYVIRSNEPLRKVLYAINRTKEGFIFCVNEDGVLQGVLTDGDVRRWLMEREDVDLRCPVAELLRPDFIHARLGDTRERIESLLNDHIKFIPLLDERNRLAGIARRRGVAHGLRIGNRMVGGQAPVFIIAEIGINHNGSVERAYRLVKAAADAGADCAKFQMRHMEALYRNSGEASGHGEDLGAQYTLNLLSRFQLPVEDMLGLFDYTRSLGLAVLCTPWEARSLEVLEEYRMEAYKVASADLTNHPLLEALARTYKPLLLSTGMADEDEIRQAADLLQRHGTVYVMLHCNSTYPAPFKDVNLNYLPRLSELAQCPVGYSGHERGIHVAMAAVAKGACVIEKHITEDRSLEGSDHRVSLLPAEFAEMVAGIRGVEEAMGSDKRRTISQGEMMNRVTLAKSLVASRDLTAGEVIEGGMIDVRSPGRGLQPNQRDRLIGRSLRRNVKAGDFFYPSDLEGVGVTARPYRFGRPWGVTVRWHDYRKLCSLSNPDFLEFHLSFKDMDEDYLTHFPEALDYDLKVHSPDTFAGDHLLDLANPDPAHRQASIRHLQRVVDLTRKLKPKFKKAERPAIIASLGGFTADAVLDAAQVAERYEILADSMSKLDCDGVEIVGQTLPPFPWYFGGQLYLNLFVRPDDTAAFCRTTGLRLCLDICHSRMACTYFGHPFKQLLEQLAPFTAHLHLADARGVDGEGLQIGEGDMDFISLAQQLNQLCPKASFIPEIWQGHKNDGEGFWIALERLEGLGL